MPVEHSQHQHSVMDRLPEALLVPATLPVLPAVDEACVLLPVHPVEALVEETGILGAQGHTVTVV